MNSGQTASAPELKLRFGFSSEQLIPSTVTETLEINPTSSYVKGSEFKNKRTGVNSSRKDSNWELELNMSNEYSTSKLLKKLIRITEGKQKDINQIAQTFATAPYVRISAHTSNEDFAIIGLDHEDIDFLNQIQADIDYDQYQDLD
jgi:hypothetical protein